MSNHYEVLGVPRDADALTLKLARRRRAAEAHPDRHGGDVDEMAAVNKAYETLSDPDARKRYDETGADNALPSLDYEAREAILSNLVRMLESDEENTAPIIGTLRKGLAQRVHEIPGEIAKRERKMAKLRRQRNKVKAKGEENYLHMVVGTYLESLSKANEQAVHVMKVLERAIVLLDTHEDVLEGSVPWESVFGSTRTIQFGDPA